MARYDDSFSVDLVIVGAGAGGGTLAQRLARRGWKVVVLESGPFWDPDQDWVSDEAGSHRLYWTDDRVTGGSDPVELGKNNCGHGVGGSMVHYAGYCPRFHPSDFEVHSRDGVGEDWPIRYSGPQAPLRAPRARTAGGRRLLAVGRSAPLPAHAASDRRRRRRRARRRPQARHRDARRTGRHHQRRVRQPSSLHLPRLLPAGLQGQRQGIAARDPHSRRDRARRRDPRALHGRRGGARRRDRARDRGPLPARRLPSASSGPRRSLSRAIRSRRRGCCSTRPAGGSPTAWRTTTTRWGGA